MSKTTKSVTVIPAITNLGGTTGLTREKKRVAAYARVSTDSDEQLTSYEAQVSHYTRHIQENPEWDFVKVYTDEGISGVTTKGRDGFQEMVADALAGKFDLLITKSVSRFARNTVDSLTTVRKLKEKSVEVYFEKENIYTLDSKGELLITIMSSLAQEESRSISENVAWGHRKRMADGRITIPYKRFLGYEKGEDGLPKIVESEAETIRLIYRLFLEGGSYKSIAKHLTDMKTLSPGGKDQWLSTTVRSILQNEKYKGAALMQKKFTEDFLTKKQKINTGELPQYYVENSHPPIIQPETFELVQAEIKRRHEHKRYPKSYSIFALRIMCGECGGFYTHKVWHSNKPNRREIWQCHYKYEQRTFCSTPHVSEDELKRAFITAYNQVLGDKNQYIEDYITEISSLSDTSELDREIAEFQAERTIVAELVKNCVEENARAALDQTEYQKKYEALVQRYNDAETRLQGLTDEKQARIAKRAATQQVLDGLRKSDSLLAEFDESLWGMLVEKITIFSKKDVVVTFKDGSEVVVSI